VPELSRLLGADFEVDGDMLRDAILNGSSANVFYLPLVLKIDFFGHPHGPYDSPQRKADLGWHFRGGEALAELRLSDLP
jgi:hypothetical protein